jgi:manganese-dependent inorganic pyrophosphatase
VDILGMDSKAYAACGQRFAVSQVEVNAADDLLVRKAELLAALRQRRTGEGLFFTALMITDVTTLSSILLVEGDETFIKKIAFPRLEPGVFRCRDILSRKKQLIPLLIEIMETVLGVNA